VTRFVPRTARRPANKTYEAERTVWNGPKARKHNERLSLVEARRLMALFDLRDWSVKKTDSGRHASGGATYHSTRTITFGTHAPWWMMLHEIAHALSTHEDGHNDVYRRNYVHVVRVALGDWWANRLVVAFREHGLPVAEMLDNESSVQ
jgi:hypothetical protein